MFDASLREILLRYSDPSKNPYTQVRLQTPKPSSSQHLVQTLHPGLDMSLGTPSANQWKPRWNLDIEAFEQTTQVLDSGGRYIQSRIRSWSSMQQVLLEREHFTPSRCGTHPRLCVQQVLPEHADSVESSCYTDEKSNACPAPMDDAATVNRMQSVPDVPQMLPSQSHVSQSFWSKRRSDSGATDEIMSVPAPANLDVQPSASGSHVDPVITTDESDALFMSDVSTSAIRDAAADKKKMDTDEGKADSRREAENREAERMEIERMEIQKIESATGEAEKREFDRMEIEKPEIERQDSVAKEAETTKEPRISPVTNTSKLLRIERKLNNKDLFMGWYKSRSSSELRYPRECIAPKIGDVYVHSCKKEGNPKFQLWVRQINRGMTIWVKAHIFHIHPKLLDRRLTLATTGEPYWSTRHSLSASGSRERAGKIAEMILY